MGTTIRRRGIYHEIGTAEDGPPAPLLTGEVEDLEFLDLLYRSLCAMLYNYVPTSGHPGGSISAGRIAASLLFDTIDCDLSRPGREEADIVSFAAGHKALGLYALWALRTEIARVGAPDLLPEDVRSVFRLEDLMGFRRNPIAATPLFTRLGARALDGHPTPATPFVRLATGASGVGLASSIGLALAALDVYGDSAPRVHIVEGEGGMTPGRVAEALAAAGTGSIHNVVLHVDWNQASIDTNRVCRDGGLAGDYVQWNPMELALLHDWNVVYVPDGFDFQMVIGAQRFAAGLANGQPTAIVYRTTKGWQYGITGMRSHGAGHALCSCGYYDALQPFLRSAGGVGLPRCEPDHQRCAGGSQGEVLEECQWEALLRVREVLESQRPVAERLAARLLRSRSRLDGRRRYPRPDAPWVEAIYAAARTGPDAVPSELRLEPESTTTLRGELGKALGHLNRESAGALLVAAADLANSTSVGLAAKDFPEGFWNPRTNPGSRLLSIGGICEDAIAGVLSGVSAFGRHVGVGSSYGAFLAPLGHVAARLHAIGNQSRRSAWGGENRPLILVCAHAGLTTGEDGPTHADPQSLQLLEGNFPPGELISLTPWDPQEIWHLLAEALTLRPSVIAPFVTRPAVPVLDRAALGLSPAAACRTGVYRLRAACGEGDGTIVLQESGVAYEFVERALPRLARSGVDLNVYYVASAEMFDSLSEEERHAIFPERRALEAMGITGFTLPTMLRWVRSDLGRSFTLHPFRKGRFLGSGPGRHVLAEAGLDGDTQFRSIIQYVAALLSRRSVAR